MNILLLHPRMLFYKIRIYNELSDRLAMKGHRLVVWCEDIQNKEEHTFDLIAERFKPAKLVSVLNASNIDIVINILFGLSIMPFYFSSIAITKFKRIPHIYYGHGVDLGALDRRWKMIFHNVVHLLFDRILLYRQEQKKYLWKIHYKKIFVANNTLALDGFEQMDGKSIDKIKKRLGIQKNKIVLFSGRIQSRKRLDVLLDFFLSEEGRNLDAALLIIGPGLDCQKEALIRRVSNIHYVGPIYDKAALQELFYITNVFCIPGHIGLGLVEAMYWGKPVLTIENKTHAPEIGYLKTGVNGYISEDDRQLIAHLKFLIINDDAMKDLSRGARQTYLREATLDRMFEGFYDVLESI